MLKTTNLALQVSARPSGLMVAPDRLVVPVQLAATGTTPLEAAQALSNSLDRIQAAVTASPGQATVAPRTYTSWTEKLAGKGLRHHGVRHHAQGTVFICFKLKAEDDFIQRVTLLESLRSALAPLDDGKDVSVGVPAWCVEDPQAHRSALMARLEDHLRGPTDLFQMHVDRFQGNQEVVVEVVGPTLAYVDLKLTADLRGNRSRAGCGEPVA